MAYLTRLVYLIIVLSIAADLLSLGDYLLSTGRRDGDTTAVQSSLFIPGASALWGLVGRAVSKASKSAIKAAKKRDKEKARKEGNARNAAKKGRREHTKNARKSTKNKHQKNQNRQQREQSRSNKKKG